MASLKKFMREEFQDELSKTLVASYAHELGAVKTELKSDIEKVRADVTVAQDKAQQAFEMAQKALKELQDIKRQVTANTNGVASSTGASSVNASSTNSQPSMHRATGDAS